MIFNQYLSALNSFYAIYVVGTYQGQWQEGKRHGYGVRTSAPFGLASHYRPKNIQTSMTSLRSNEGGSGSVDAAEKRNHRMDEIRGGFVLKAKSDEPPARRNSLVEKTRKGLLSVSIQTHSMTHSTIKLTSVSFD